AMLTFGPIGHPGGCAALAGFDADAPGLNGRMDAAMAAVVPAGATALPTEYGEHWWEHRNDAVALYRRIMGPQRAFGTGVVVETMEVAGLGLALPALYVAVRSELLAHAEAVGCHLSHVYRSGSSLYFTFLVRGADDEEAIERYRSAWAGGIRACLAHGGTITHHHGVGR